ncbi:MAG: MFS transporter [Alcanivoracaceae bacterium]|nr:MFS transporter [Alcanivoracaceae bacterium]
MKNLAIGEFFINIGKAILLLSFAKFLYDETGQIWAISLSFLGDVLMSTLIPMLVGRSVDKNGVKNILMLSAFLHVLFAILGIALLFTFGISSLLLLGISILLSSVWPISRMAVFNVTPLLSSHDDLEKDNGVLSFAFQAGQLIGMVSAGWLLHKFGFIIILSIVTALFILSFIFYYLVSHTIKQSHSISKIGEKNGQVKLGKLFKKSIPFIPIFILSNFDFIGIAIFNILLVSIVAENFDGSSFWLAGLDSSFAIGALLGGAFIAKELRKRSSDINDVILMQIIFFIYLVLTVVTDLKYFLPIMALFIGLFQSYSGVYWRTKLQKELPKELMGSLTGIKYIISSVHIGIIVMIISYAHQLSYTIAIIWSSFIIFIQFIALLYTKKREQIKTNAKIY